MPKATKSSASSGTRKKHARKATGPAPGKYPASQTSKSKPSKKEIKKGLAPPPKKSYIPPSKLKPAPVQVDPLNSMGLAALLPAELVVVLRRLAKKDGVTKRRALEELEMWINKTKKEIRDVGILVNMLPVWLYRFPALSVHPSRRIRHLSASLHASLLELPTLRSSILTFLRETGSETEVSQVLGSWCLSAWDVDRGVAARGSRSWKNAVNARPGEVESVARNDDDERLVLNDVTLAQCILPFILTTIMDPASTYLTLNPLPSAFSGDSPSSSHLGTPRRGASTPVGAPSGSSARRVVGNEALAALPSRVDDDPESVEDRNARLRVSAMGVLTWVFDTYPLTSPLAEPLHGILSSPVFWTVLHHAVRPPFLRTQESLSESGDVGEVPFILSDTAEGFGAGQTIVRRAGWSIVHALVGGAGGSWRDHLAGTDSAQGLPSSAVIRSAFVEPDPMVRSSMWEPLLVFLTKINQVWLFNVEFERATSSGNQHIENDDDSGSESTASEHEVDSSPPNPNSTVEPAAHSPSSSTAYAEFLAFLALGCNGSPVQGYPTVLVILSTLPREILPPRLPALSEFFDALWAAIDGQALSTLAAERAKGSEAFLGAWGESLVWTVGKLVKGVEATRAARDTSDGLEGSQFDSTDDESPEAVSRALVSAQFGRLIAELGKGLRVDASVAGGKVAAVLGKMEVVGRDFFDEAWKHVSVFASATISNEGHEARGEYALSFLATLHQHLSLNGPTKQQVEEFVVKVATEILQRCFSELQQNDEGTVIEATQPEVRTRDGVVVEKLLERFGEVLLREEGFVQHLDNLLNTKLSALLIQPSLILAYLTHRCDTIRILAVWRHLLSTIGSSPDVEMDTKVRVLNVFLDAVHQDGISRWAEPQGGELDALAGQALSGALDGDAVSFRLAERLLKTPGPFLADRVVQKLVSTILTAIDTHAYPLIRDPSASLKTLRSSLGLLLALEQDAPTTLRSSTGLPDVMPGVFVLAFVLPQCSPLEEERMVSGLARQVWETWRDLANEEARGAVSEKVKHVLKDLVMDTNVRPGPAAMLYALPYVHPEVESRPILDIILAQSELDTLLSTTSSDPIDGSLAIIEPLAPPSASTRATSRSSWNRDFDNSGFSPYARGVSALLHVLTADRQVARENMWALHHALTLALFASEVLQVPGAESPVFGSNHKVSEMELREISRQTQQIAAFLLTSPVEEEWHKDVVDALSGKTTSDSLNSMGQFVRLMFEQSRTRDTVRDSLVLHTVLQHVLCSATKDDADLWTELARSIGDEALQTSLAISLAVTEFAPEPPKLDRYRNELASKVADVPPNKANTTGLRLLRRLSAVAPNPESDVIFLPQQRAVYLVQTLQAWMGSEEDLNEKVESEITLVLFNLAPILQHVQGAHWEFIVDLIESNIENSSFKEAETLVILSRTLRLLTIVQDLAALNKYLRELWGQRSKVILILVRDLLAVTTDRTAPSVPRAICREQALSIVQDLPGSSMDENTLSTMCHLVTDPSVDVQKMAHQLLQQAAIRRTEHLVVEAGVDSENMVVIELPAELVVLLQNIINFEIDVGEVNTGCQDPLAYLLGWMITFDLFSDASLKVKTAYVDQLRNLDLIGSYFLPNIFEILGVGGDGQRPFKLDAWAVDEYWVSMYDADAPESLRLLAAHVYYRALLTVPSLIRSWWLELKDRQLSTAVTAFTSLYFSPVLISSELVHVKPSSSAPAPATGEESLTDESFNVKVALAINEVTATFNVDDQQMEIGVRLPAEYPLKAVEVRDIRRVGVPDNLWRKWLFAVQQVVTSQNGRIVDGLGLFKKNVSLHFEGQVECAICYSIISVVDRSLPTKPCKTCKNRFHASCLYKWFNSSHSSSCPLCRSDIM